ncbi:MAG: hypothetical protein AAGA68_12230 [Pseudomonadota bacterium]
MDTDKSGNWLATLESLALISVSGVDSESFLQGQLSNDVTALGPDRPAQLSSLSTARGRVFSVMLVIRNSAHDFGLVVPKAGTSELLNRLRMFVLRSKVALAETPEAHFQGLSGTMAERFFDAESAPASRWQARWLSDGQLAIRWPDPNPRVLSVSLAPAEPSQAPADDERWWQRDISAGIPWITSEATREEFVAQMLDLDLLEGISFQKGCYTGQEVIARTHYLGRVKRRLRRYGIDEENVIPGAHIEAQLPNGRWQKAGSVLLAGQSEVLAVLQLELAQHALRLAARGEHEAPGGTLTPLELPR